MAKKDDIIKSTRHPKIIGTLGEYMVSNWLSREGFEVTVVDHTGIDIIACPPKSGQRMGISVKSRTRRSGSEVESVNLFFSAKMDRERLKKACEAFGCEPWIAVYVETADDANLYLLSLAHYDKHYRGKTKRKIDDWKMTSVIKREYATDPEVHHIRITFDRIRWNWDRLLG